MKNIGRILLWLIASIAALACILLITANLYVQSQGTHRRIQQELSQRLDTPLSLRQISITPWSGLKLSGITIPQESAKIGGNFLEAESFQLRVKFWSIFSDRLVIRQVLLVKPQVVWAQNSAGKWRLPQLPTEKQPKVATATSTAAVPTPASKGRLSPLVATPAPTMTVHPNEPRLAETPSAPFAPEVQRVNLKQGDFVFLDSNGRVIAKFLGLDFHSSFRTATALKGSASVAKISLRDRFFIEYLDSPLRYDPIELSFSNISAQAGGGQISGRFEMQPQTADSPFTASVKFHDLQADKLVTNAGGPAGMIHGRLEGFLEAQGKTADSNALEGRGEIVLRDGQIQQYSLLVALGQILQIDELMQLKLEQAEVKYRVSPGIVTIDQLILRSPNVLLTATGTISFKGKLHLDSQLALNDKVRRQLFAPIRDNFQPIDTPAGYAAVNFAVSGTVDRPKTDLMDKLVGRDLRDLGGVISSLFGHPKKKKQREQSSPSPSPESSPDERPTNQPASATDSTASPSESVPVTSPTP